MPDPQTTARMIDSDPQLAAMYDRLLPSWARKAGVTVGQYLASTANNPNAPGYNAATAALGEASSQIYGKAKQQGGGNGKDRPRPATRDRGNLMWDTQGSTAPPRSGGAAPDKTYYQPYWPGNGTGTGGNPTPPNKAGLSPTGGPPPTTPPPAPQVTPTPPNAAAPPPPGPPPPAGNVPPPPRPPTGPKGPTPEGYQRGSAGAHALANKKKNLASLQSQLAAATKPADKKRIQDAINRLQQEITAMNRNPNPAPPPPAGAAPPPQGTPGNPDKAGIKSPTGPGVGAPPPDGPAPPPWANADPNGPPPAHGALFSLTEDPEVVAYVEARMPQWARDAGVSVAQYIAGVGNRPVTDGLSRWLLGRVNALLEEQGYTPIADWSESRGWQGPPPGGEPPPAEEPPPPAENPAPWGWKSEEESHRIAQQRFWDQRVAMGMDPSQVPEEFQHQAPTGGASAGWLARHGQSPTPPQAPGGTDPSNPPVNPAPEGPPPPPGGFLGRNKMTLPQPPVPGGLKIGAPPVPPIVPPNPYPANDLELGKPGGAQTKVLHGRWDGLAAPPTPPITTFDPSQFHSDALPPMPPTPVTDAGLAPAKIGPPMLPPNGLRDGYPNVDPTGMQFNQPNQQHNEYPTKPKPRPRGGPPWSYVKPGRTTKPKPFV